MKKYKRMLQLLMICLVMVLGVWLGMKIEHRQNEKHEEYLQELNTTVAVVNQDLGVTINDMSVNYANAVIEILAVNTPWCPLPLHKGVLKKEHTEQL